MTLQKSDVGRLLENSSAKEEENEYSALMNTHRNYTLGDAQALEERQTVMHRSADAKLEGLVVSTLERLVDAKLERAADAEAECTPVR